MSFIKTTVKKMPGLKRIRVSFSKASTVFKGKQITLDEFEKQKTLLSEVMSKKDFESLCNHFHQVPNTNMVEFI